MAHFLGWGLLAYFLGGGLQAFLRGGGGWRAHLCGLQDFFPRGGVDLTEVVLLFIVQTVVVVDVAMRRC